MLTSEFSFHFPQDLVATEALPERDKARLFLTWTQAHRHDSKFRDLPSLLRGDEVLVFNDTRVVPCRLFGSRATGGRVEIFLTRPRQGSEGLWHCLAKPTRRLRNGEKLKLHTSDNRDVRIFHDGEAHYVDLGMPHEDTLNYLKKEGIVPLPPYISRPSREDDRDRYQTVYARYDGSCAAPTAGLHFTPELLHQIAEKGCSIVHVTLHVGIGTFVPVQTRTVEDHDMHSEWFRVSDTTLRFLSESFQSGREVICVGTTALRAVESAMQQGPEGETKIFFHPGNRPRWIRSLITNFHLPSSTLFMLVCSLVGVEEARRLYKEAFQERYRLFSYGDGMWIRTLH